MHSSHWKEQNNQKDEDLIIKYVKEKIKREKSRKLSNKIQ